jgi:hypothetical protein
MTEQLDMFPKPSKPKAIKWWGKDGWFATECQEKFRGDWRKYWKYQIARDRHIWKVVGPDTYLKGGHDFDETEEGKRLLNA